MIELELATCTLVYGPRTRPEGLSEQMWMEGGRAPAACAASASLPRPAPRASEAERRWRSDGELP
jgi:hypothetical protein